METLERAVRCNVALVGKDARGIIHGRASLTRNLRDGMYRRKVLTDRWSPIIHFRARRLLFP